MSNVKQTVVITDPALEQPRRIVQEGNHVITVVAAQFDELSVEIGYKEFSELMASRELAPVLVVGDPYHVVMMLALIICSVRDNFGFNRVLQSFMIASDLDGFDTAAKRLASNPSLDPPAGG